MISKIQKQALQKLLRTYPPVVRVRNEIHKAGGTVLVVGGAVRDLLLGLPVKDLDIEVHGLSVDELHTILKEFGHVRSVGKAYGVLRLDGLDVDWSIPRKDSAGRKPRVVIDPSMGYRQAFERRDLTINAMGINLTTYELVDPFHGYRDLKKGVLRATNNERFQEDPLRFYRVMQFIARFGFKPNPSLTALCKKMNVRGVSVERIEQEIEKMILRSHQPSLGFRWLRKIGRINELFPELALQIGVKQSRRWHPEGDVFEHTMQAFDAAAALSYDSVAHKIIITLAALCHDLGKALTTEKIGGRWRSPGHAEAGVPLAKKLLKRMTTKKYVIDTVAKLVRYHMEPLAFTKQKAKPAAYKRLARKLAPEATLQMLGQLALADRRGRNPKKGKPLTAKMPDVQNFLKKAERAHVLEYPEEPVLKGRDLKGHVAPGPAMGALLKKAYEIQIDEGIRNKATLKKRVLDYT